jgi:NADH-quinone oxidoreductase subunit F
MDLRTSGQPASAAEIEAVDSVLGSPASIWEGAARPVGNGQAVALNFDGHGNGTGRAGRAAADGRVAFGGAPRPNRRTDLLLPILHALQERVGCVTHGALDYVSRRLGVPPAEAYGVASAYAMLALNPTPPVVLHVCDDIACRASCGGDDPAMAVERLLGPPGEGYGEAAQLVWERSPCLGHCEHGTAAFVQLSGERGGRRTLAPLGEVSLAELAGVAEGADPSRLCEMPEPESIVPQIRLDRSRLRLLRRIGLVDPESLDSYVAHGGYEALRRAIALGPAATIREVKDAKLLGRGGAAFPTALKWDAVARNPERPHYFVVNADESEPGTFKDRVLIEKDPFALVEAATVAGLATGSERVYVYVRGEYPLAERRLRLAVEAAERRGLLGSDVMGSGLSCEIEVRRGAGAYIAGEETALFNSIEGKRPEPRNKPPFPVDRGLFAKPTGVNNVETLLCVLEAVLSGGEAFASTGTPDSTGTRLFCLSGCVERPGLYEVPLGTPLGELVELAGGVRAGRSLSAVLLGGAAGSFVAPTQLDMPLSFEGARAAGTTLGSGVVVLLDDSVEVVGLLRRIAQFFRDESCGQCVPCRVGTVRQEELLGRLSNRTPLGSFAEELALLGDLGSVMRDASICGLGQTASSAVESALRLNLVALSNEEER